ncbi:MAG: hypothetical protein EOO20_00320 [Chryseobacterium sp.]|nr:MAG: hypothetical protein EOO20_00320 [Chryseobacterium sp.]
MSKHKDEWYQLLGKQNMPKWEIFNNADNISIKVPNDQDLRLIAGNFPDTIVLLHPDISSPNEELVFIVGNDSNSFEFTLHASANIGENPRWIL